MPPTPTFATYPTTVAAILEFQRSRSLPRLMRAASVMSESISSAVGMFVRVFRTLRACTRLTAVSSFLESQRGRAVTSSRKETLLAMRITEKMPHLILLSFRLAKSELGHCTNEGSHTTHR